MRSINRLNEEIARWAFEILFKTNEEWKIAFTNPTAGPWKTIKANSLIDNTEGEVYRFILEEDRPDIIMYNDQLEAIIIIEAKDSLEKLMVGTQAQKSAAVVVKLANILKSKATNHFWKGREKYSVILGLLWGSTDNPETESEKNKLYDYYRSLVAGEEIVNSDLVIGVETLYKDENLKCTSYFKDYSGTQAPFGEAIVKSLMK
jgi:hypothetical protein